MLVRESISFERYRNPKEALGLVPYTTEDVRKWYHDFHNNYNVRELSQKYFGARNKYGQVQVIEHFLRRLYDYEKIAPDEAFKQAFENTEFNGYFEKVSDEGKEKIKEEVKNAIKEHYGIIIK